MKTRILLLPALFLSTSALAATPLTKAQVRSLVEPTESQVKTCAQAAGMHGTLRVTFMVNPDGSVSSFKAKRPHVGDAAAKCAQDAITAIKFPESTKGRHSKYRFQLGAPAGGSTSTGASAAHDGIADALKGADFAACGKGQKGSVKAKFTVGVDGTAGSVVVKGKHAKDDVGSCVADTLSKVKFPPQQKPTTVTRTIKL